MQTTCESYPTSPVSGSVQGLTEQPVVQRRLHSTGDAALHHGLLDDLGRGGFRPPFPICLVWATSILLESPLVWRPLIEAPHRERRMANAS